MSTRANVIIKDNYQELIFYRHSDGYPEGALPTLKKLLRWVKDGRIRADAMQAAGWLVIIGHREYEAWIQREYQNEQSTVRWGEPGKQTSSMGWKVGAYEPTDQIHGDIDYLYVVDLATKTISIDGADGFEYSGKFRPSI